MSLKQIPYYLFVFALLFALAGSLTGCSHEDEAVYEDKQVGLTAEKTVTDEFVQSEKETTAVSEYKEIETELPSAELSEDEQTETVSVKPTETELTEPEPFEETTEEKTVALPTSDEIYSLVLPLSDWAANIYLDRYNQNSEYGKIKLNTNRAVELAGLALTYDSGRNWNYTFPAEAIQDRMTYMFGSQFSIENFTNSSPSEEWPYEYGTAFMDEFPNMSSLQWVYRTASGDFYVDCLITDSPPQTTAVTVKNIIQNNDGTCTAVVEYDIDNSFPYDNFYNTWSKDISYDLIPDKTAKYGWAITTLTVSDEYNWYSNVDFGEDW